MTTCADIHISTSAEPDGPAQVARRIAFRALRGLIAILVGIATLFISFPWLGAAEAPPTLAMMKPADMRAGSLLVKRDDNGYADAIRLGIDVDLTVSGPTIRARVTQVFRNPTQDWVEAIYVYPLPEGSAVDTLKMVVGDRIVVGEIKERQQARVIYEQARQNGQRAALTEQERPNIFTNSVANIGPGETVLVQIEYQEPVRQSDGVFSLRVPLVVGPRYNPAPVVQSVDLRPDQGGWGTATNDPVPDRARISPPVLDPAQNAPINPTTITVKLQAGFPIGEVKSHHHAARIESPSADVRIVSLAQGVTPADRDFELTWARAAEKAPSVGLFRERIGQSDYLLAFVTPPAVEPSTQKPLPREAIFVIDNSGSMGGPSMDQAKASLIYALGRLQPGDRFNVIRFDHTMDMLFPSAVPADREHLAQARAFVEALQASGGTEMLPAMRAALNDQLGTEFSHVRQVIFLTDGAIGNEQQLFDAITALRGRSRVFMVGIGSAPNSFLMTRAAELGRGTFTHIGAAEQVEQRMLGLFARLENPVVTGLTARFSDTAADATPAAIPDLYRAEPLVIAAKIDRLAGSVELRGQIGDRPWVITLPVASAAEGRGLSKVWARRKIADAEVARTMRQAAPQDADRRILALALEHQLVSRLTSLVAVDKTPSRPAGAPLKVSELPLNLPAGWDFDKVFGREHAPEPPKPALEQHTSVDDRTVTHASVHPKANTSGPSMRMAQLGSRVASVRPVLMPTIQLPKTATDAELRMMAGAALLALAIVLLAFTRRRCHAH